MPVPPQEGKTAGAQLRGKVRKVLIDQNTLLLTDEQGADRTARLAENGKVFANNLAGKLEALKPGDNVWLAYAEQGKELAATEIRGSGKRRFVQIRGIENPD